MMLLAGALIVAVPAWDAYVVEVRKSMLRDLTRMGGQYRKAYDPYNKDQYEGSLFPFPRRKFRKLLGDFPIDWITPDGNTWGSIDRSPIGAGFPRRVYRKWSAMGEAGRSS